MDMARTHSILTAEEVRTRIAALQSMAVLDTPPEEAFDAVTKLAAAFAKTPIAIVSLVDGERLWFKSKVGVAASEIPSENSFCSEAATSRQLLHVTDARNDLRFNGNALVRGALQIQFYAGAPIVVNGVGIGTVCVLDYEPRSLDDIALNALADLGTIATSLLRARIEAFALFESSRL